MLKDQAWDCTWSLAGDRQESNVLCPFVCPEMAHFVISLHMNIL